MIRASTLRAAPWLGPLLCFTLLLAHARGSDEARFDPPLDGVFLGMSGEAKAGRLLVKEVEPGSAAARAGLIPGDQIARLGPAAGFPDFEAFARQVQLLRRGEPVELEVLREGRSMGLSLVPDPAVLRDHYQLIAYLRDSSFLRARDGFPALLADLEASVPPALREAARSSDAYEILNRALGRFGTSHTAVIPPWTYRNLFAGEEEGREGYGTGLLLERGAGGGSFFAVDLLDESPAVRAGLLPGDEVLRVNGLEVERSPRRALAGYEAGRPRYTLQVERGETIVLELRRTAGGGSLTAALTADEPVSGFKASAASLRHFEEGGRRLAYLHLWNLLSTQLPGLVKRALAQDENYAEGLVIDLRGRGGQVAVTSRVAAALRAVRRPMVFLVDRETRSAKEILAFRMKGLPQATLVGERTAGAVLPGSLRRLSGGAMVMLPADPSGINEITEGGLEGKGVDPDVPVSRAGHYSAGSDPILRAGIEVLLLKLKEVPPRRRW
jgi:C-terminal processing protease CtpA/Prc